MGLFDKFTLYNVFRGYNVIRADIEVLANDVDDKDHESEPSRLFICSQCERQQLRKPSKLRRLAWILRSGWALSVILLFWLLVHLWLSDRGLQQKCFRETSSYTPLLGQVPDTLQEFRFNGSIRWPSPYRGPPSPDVDRAWEKISMFRPLNIPLTEKEFLNVGKSPETAATNPPEYGGGFFLQPEFSHQLHCVNFLRKASHFKYDYYKNHDPDFQDKEETFKVHLDHCVEMLRQFVMCHADIGVVTAHWIEQRARPWPDFNTMHTCRDFEGIWQWTVDHQMPEGTPMIPLKPVGAKALPSPP
ncbi:hypothetical protein UA08_01258 [Talaromyces atroroseus]|uniref:Tat pathway signal sequence n=1 Tax=Talaromyces atroroseus TaxID=1441469 RepID=A0A1Q5QB26_TALAT|nr:hypothetical protein UA08_01258 [Talaromyces atroroseus]OKL63126.1 hypothetical protein UA08_01258 [Talaromyces atroroseus]